MARLSRMRRVVWLAVMALRDCQAADGGELVMYTLTYERVAEWEPRHISRFVRWLRSQGARAYVWVAELQRRGAVHYHVLALLAAGARWVKPDAAAGGWARGFTWVTPDVRRPFYIMKYLQKGGKDGTSNSFPKGLRLYGASAWAMRRASFQDRLAYRDVQLPAWSRDPSKDAASRLASKRVSGGVSYNSMVEYSPYTKGDLPNLVDTRSAMSYAFCK